MTKDEAIKVLRNQVKMCRIYLESINSLACFASEENISAREVALLAIGSEARQAIAHLAATVHVVMRV